MTAEDHSFQYNFHLMRATSIEICCWAITLNICKHSTLFYFTKIIINLIACAILKANPTYLIYICRQKQMSQIVKGWGLKTRLLYVCSKFCTLNYQLKSLWSPSMMNWGLHPATSSGKGRYTTKPLTPNSRLLTNPPYRTQKPHPLD